jgi:CIC family chloride channel protein
MTSVFMIFEITQDYQILVPLMVANMLSYVISRRYQPTPVYHALLRQDGVHLPSPAQAPTTARTARHVMRADVLLIAPQTSVEDAWRWALEHEADAYLVGTRDRLVGSVTRQRLEQWYTSDRASNQIGSLVEPTFVHAHPDHSIDVVLDRLSESGGVLPIVSRTEVRRVEGVVTRDSILAATERQTANSTY